MSSFSLLVVLVVIVEQAVWFLDRELSEVTRNMESGSIVAFLTIHTISVEAVDFIGNIKHEELNDQGWDHRDSLSYDERAHL